MEEIVCYCLKCKGELATFNNSFSQIGTSYFSPIYPPQKGLYGLQVTGDLYSAAEGSQVENSVLQDLACKSCTTVLGLQCDSAPENHLLKKCQLLLRLAHMNVVSTTSRKKVVIDVKEKFALTGPGVKKSANGRRISTDQATNNSQPMAIASRPISNGGSSMLPPPTPARGQDQDSIERELDQFKQWAQDAITTQKQDIGRIGATIDRVEQEMKSLREFMSQLRADMARTLQTSLTDDDLMVVRKDLNGFRDELATHQQQQAEINARMTAPDISAHEFNSISMSLRRVNDRAAQVEELKADLSYLRTRLESLESRSQDTAHTNSDVFASVGAPLTEGLWGSQKSSETLADPVRQLGSHWHSSNEHASLDPESEPILPKLPGLIEPTRMIAPVQEILDSQDSLSSRGPSFSGLPLQNMPITSQGVEQSDNLPLGLTERGLIKVSPKRIAPAERWVYTGSLHHHSLAKVCHAFGIDYPGKSTAVKSVEKFVNSNRLFNTADAQKYGKVVLKDSSKKSKSKTEGHNLPEDELKVVELKLAVDSTPLLRKRQHNDDVKASEKRRKQSSRSSRKIVPALQDSENDLPQNATSRKSNHEEDPMQSVSRQQKAAISADECAEQSGIPYPSFESKIMQVPPEIDQLKKLVDVRSSPIMKTLKPYNSISKTPRTITLPKTTSVGKPFKVPSTTGGALKMPMNPESEATSKNIQVSHTISPVEGSEPIILKPKLQRTRKSKSIALEQTCSDDSDVSMLPEKADMPWTPMKRQLSKLELDKGRASTGSLFSVVIPQMKAPDPSELSSIVAHTITES